MKSSGFSIPLKSTVLEPKEVIFNEPYIVCRYLYKAIRFFVVYPKSGSKVVCSFVHPVHKQIECKDYVYNDVAMQHIEEKVVRLPELPEHIENNCK